MKVTIPSTISIRVWLPSTRLAKAAACALPTEEIGKEYVSADSVDADHLDQVVALLRRHNPDLVINLG